MPRTLLYVSPSRKPHSPLLGAVGALGVSAPPHRKWGSRGGFSISACRGHCFMALCPGNRTAHCRGAVGLWTLPHHPAGSRKAEGAFPPEPPEALVLYGCAVPETAQSIAGAQWGTGASHYPAGSRKAEQAFPSAHAGDTALWLSVPEPAQSIARALCGAGASASPSRKQESRVAFPPEPPEALALWLSAPEIVQSIAGAQWGYERFRIMPPGMGAML